MVVAVSRSRALAWHEGGHAVAVVLFGFPIMLASVLGRGSVHACLAPRGEIDYHLLRQERLLQLAGPVAEWMATPDAPRPDSVREHFRILLQDDNVWPLDTGVRTRRDVLAHEWRYAGTWLGGCRDTIAAVAERLEADGTVSGEAICHVVRDVGGYGGDVVLSTRPETLLSIDGTRLPGYWLRSPALEPWRQHWEKAA